MTYVPGGAGSYAPLASPAFTGVPTIGGVAVITTAALPLSTGMLLGDSPAGAAVAITIGSGLTLTSDVLSADPIAVMSYFLGYSI